MTRRGGFAVVVCALAAVLSGCAALAAETPADEQTTTQTPPPPQPQSQTGTAGAQGTGSSSSATEPLPVDLNRIRDSLNQPQVLKLGMSHIRFYAETQAKAPTFMDLVGTFDLHKGAAPHASAMSGSEFVNMTTPKEMYSEAGITATDMLQFAATNLAAQTLIRKAVDEIRSAHDASEIAAIRARIDRELAALMGKGGGSH